MEKKFFRKKHDKDQEEAYLERMDESLEENTDDSQQAKKEDKKSWILSAVALAAAALSLFCGIGFGFHAYQNGKIQKQVKEAVKEYVHSSDTELTEQIRAAVDAYSLEHQPENLVELVGEEGIKELTEAVVSDLGNAKLTEEQRKKFEDAVVKLFTSDGALTISGKAVFDDASKEYLTRLITEEMEKTLVEYYGDGGDGESLMKKYGNLEASVKKILSSQVANATVTYSLTDADRDNIKRSVIASLGNLQGADGKDGKDGKEGDDGRDGRDGKDGKDGHTPVKGSDYFTEAELDLFVRTVEHNVKDYFDHHELDEIAAMTESIKNNVLSIFNQSADSLEESIQKNRDEITQEYTGMIGTLERNIEELINKVVSGLSQSIEDTANQTNDKLESMKNDTASKLESLQGDTDSRLESIQSDTDGRLESLQNNTDSKLESLQNNTDSKLESIQSDTDSRLESLQNDTDSKIVALGDTVEEKITNLSVVINQNLNFFKEWVNEQFGQVDSRVDAIEKGQAIYELTDNGDGTFSLSITDPKHID